jgi:uncharacterized protein with ParB-like and HNH nuclease domain
MIVPETKRIGVIFSEGNAQLEIPSNQRNFDWGQDEVRELIDDLQASQREASGSLFLGNMIFDVSKYGKRKVVDGQQRLTTISLLLIACRTRASELNNAKQVSEIQKKITFVDEVSGESLGPRIIVSPSIKDVFDFICDDDWDLQFPTTIANKSVRRQSNKVKPVFQYIYKEVKNYKQSELDAILKAVYDAYVIQISISNTQDAFDIFERTNARGLDLNVADLVKNYLFASQDIDDVEEKWQGIVENSSNSMQRMLKYFWVSRKGYVKRADLYREIKKYGNDVGAIPLVSELEDFSKYFSVVQSLDEKLVKEWFNEIGFTQISQNETYYQIVSRVFQALKFFRVTQAYPLIYSMIIGRAHTKEKASSKPKPFLNALEDLEKYHFVNNVICERIGNEVEKFYSDYSLKFNSKAFGPTLIEFKKELKAKLATKEEFVTRFVEIAYSPSDPALIHYIFDRINNYGLRGGQRMNLFFPRKEYLLSNFNRDHILPQSYKKSTSISLELKEAIDNIGNILVLSRHSNSGFNDLPPREKIKMLRETEHSGSLVYLKDFLQTYEKDLDNWTEDKIYARATNLANDGYDRVWKLS